VTGTGLRKAYDLKIMIKVKSKHVCVTMIDSLLKLRTSAKLLLNLSYDVTRDLVGFMIYCTTCKLFLIILLFL